MSARRHREVVETLTITWPIVDGDMPMSDLMREARESLHLTMQIHGMRPVQRPAITVQRGLRPTITARVKVAIEADGRLAA